MDFVSEDSQNDAVYWHFGPYRLDFNNGFLWKGAERYRLIPKDLSFLHYLISHPNQLVSKEELLQKLWPDTVVHDGVLKTCVRRLRILLKDDSQTPRFIETVHRRGYRFICDVEARSGPLQTPPPGFLQRAVTARRSPATTAIGLVEREEPFAALLDATRSSMRGERSVCFVTGEAGIGKSRLLSALAEEVTGQGDGYVLRACCRESIGPKEPYGPVIEALEGFGKENGEDTELLGSLLRKHAPMWLLQMPSFASMAERVSLQSELIGTGAPRMRRELAVLLESLSESRPLLFLMENLQWADTETLDALAFLLDRPGSARLLVAISCRPPKSLEAPYPLWVNKCRLSGKCSEISLLPLSPTGVDTFLTLYFPGKTIPFGLSQWLFRYTEGNPLYIQALLEHALARG